MLIDMFKVVCLKHFVFKSGRLLQAHRACLPVLASGTGGDWQTRGQAAMSWLL